jgi:hypothetical protein
MVTEPIGHDLAGRFGTGGKHAPEKPLHRSLVATLLQEDIKLCAVLIDCPPQQIRLAAQCPEYFVQMPCGAELATRCFHSVCKARTEFIAPAPDRFIAHNHPALEQQLFDVTNAQLKPEIPANGITDDCGREPMTAI